MTRSLASMLFTLSTALLLANTVNMVAAAEADQAAVAAIKRLGGAVLPIHEGLEIEFHLRGRALTDEGLAHVASLKNIDSLNLKRTKVTDAGLAQLRGLTSLRRLHLEQTAIGDEGVKHLAALVNLEYLNLFETKITDRSLEQLKRLRKLKRLYVWNTAVTEQAAAQLEAALPDVKVVRGVDMSKLASQYATKKPRAQPSESLKWHPVASRDEAPDKSNSGSNTLVHFENKTKAPVQLFWITYAGDLKLYGEIAAGATREQNTYANNAWLICNQSEEPLGYFVVKAEEATAVIPASK